MQESLSLASFGAAFGAGLLSVLSPCVMPLMPAYLSLISGISVDEMRGPDFDARLRRRVLQGCLGFVLGLSTVFVLLGATATAIGRTLVTWRVEILGIEVGFAQLSGLVIILMGLHLTGLLRIGLLERDTRMGARFQPRSFAGTYLVGAAFAFGWTPCVGPILGSILTVASVQETVGRGMLLLAVYSAGLSLPFLLAGWSIELFFRGFQRIRRHMRAIQIGSGVLLLLLGLLVVTDRLSLLNEYFLFLNDWVTALEARLL